MIGTQGERLRFAFVYWLLFSLQLFALEPEQRKMLTMSQINHIKDLSNCGYRITEISKKNGC